MTVTEIAENIKRDEFDGEKLISYFRLLMAFIFISSVPLLSFSKVLKGENHFPPVAYICCAGFLIYSVFIFFYLRKRESVSPSYKYICVILDILIHSASIWIGCTYPLIAPAISYLSTWALFYFLLIMAGAFRYSVRCAYFSGFFGGVCYFLVVLINGKQLDLPYYFLYANDIINVNFPVYNEAFRSVAMIIIGIITGMACKRRFNVFNSLLETQNSVSDAAEKTINHTRNMALTIQNSTGVLFKSSKDIFTSANNQAASIQEIESTILENTLIADEIANKTSSVASIARNMENDVAGGFSILERNIAQLSDIKNKNDDLTAGIISLGEKISKIREIIATINTITDQTKVIAFNAALEAANAGDQGRRFAVVASEVNRLADDIASLTSLINDQAGEIQNSSSSLIHSGEESARKITKGNNLIKELEEIFGEIKNGAEITANQAQTITVSTHKQQKSSEQIKTAIADISAGLSNFINSTEIASSSAEELVKLIKELEELIADKTGRENNSGAFKTE